MSQDLVKVKKAEEIAQEAIEMFDKVSQGISTPAELAELHGYSVRTVYNRINQARDIINDELRKNGSKYFADVWQKYDYIWQQANDEWKATRNSKFLTEMRSVLEAFRKMQSLDAAPKAPMTEVVAESDDRMIMVFDEAGYKEKEELLKLETTVEGSFTESSTEVLLTPETNDDTLTQE